VAAANLLALPLRAGRVTTRDLRQVQRRRAFPAWLTQRLQVFVQDRVLSRMPVSSALAESNRSQTERLRQLVRRLDAAMLGERLPNGWTVAGALTHILPGRMAAPSAANT